MVALERFGDSADGTCLVVALDDRRIDRCFRQRSPGLAALDQKFQLRFLIESLHPARRMALVIPDPVLVAVGIKDDRPPAELPFQAIGVQFGLLLPDARISTRALGLDQSERLAVVAPQHIVHEAFSLGIRHAADLELPLAGLVERPSRFFEQQVEKVVAGLSLGVVVGVRLGSRRLFRFGDLGAQAFQFLIERGLVREQGREIFVLLAQAHFESLQLLGRPRGACIGRGRLAGSKTIPDAGRPSRA